MHRVQGENNGGENGCIGVFPEQVKHEGINKKYIGYMKKKIVKMVTVGRQSEKVKVE